MILKLKFNLFFFSVSASWYSRLSSCRMFFQAISSFLEQLWKSRFVNKKISLIIIHDYFLKIIYKIFIFLGTFSQYDYGSLKNLQIYNSTTPPSYPLENVKVPIAVFHGINDYLVTQEVTKFYFKFILFCYKTNFKQRLQY